MAARYPRCAVLMWLHGVVRHRYVAAMVRREEESGRVDALVRVSWSAVKVRLNCDSRVTVSSLYIVTNTIVSSHTMMKTTANFRNSNSEGSKMKLKIAAHI